jgi:hypothetical protein
MEGGRGQEPDHRPSAARPLSAGDWRRTCAR